MPEKNDSYTIKTTPIYLRICAIFCIIPYFLLLNSHWHVQMPGDLGLLTPLLSQAAFTGIYAVIWVFVLGYELFTLRQLLSSWNWACTFSLLLPVGFVGLYQYGPPFPNLSRFLCVCVLLAKLILILLLSWKAPREKQAVRWQMILEFLVLCSASLNGFFFLRHWA